MGTIPSKWQQGTIQGTFLDGNFDPFVGRAKIHPDAPSARSFGEASALLVDRLVTLDGTGSFSVSMPASNDPDVSPVGWTYTVTIETLDGTRSGFPEYTFVLPVGQTVDLDEVTVVTPSIGIPNIIGGGGGGPTTVDQITDAGAAGKAVVRAATAQAARDAIGASSLVLGTTSTTAKAGNDPGDFATLANKPATFTPSAHTHNLTDIAGTTATGQAILSSSTPAAARTAIGMTTTGSSIVTAADGPAAASAIGALATASKGAANGVPGLDASSHLTYATAETGSRFDLPCPAGVQPTRPSTRTDIYFDWLMVAEPVQGPGYAITGDGWRREAW